MDVLSMIKHSLVADGVNPITKYFRLEKQVASAGPELVWKIYDAVRIADGKEASVFLFDKKIAEKLHKPRRRELVTEILRNEIKHLTRLKHPKILTVLHPAEECHDSLAFASVPVSASLANLLGNRERLPTNISQELKDQSLLEIEIKYGILQVTEALSYLHATEHIVHMNVCPQSIIITKRGMWKLAGFGFAECPDNGTMKSSYLASPWTPKHSKMVQPDLDYMAPDVQLRATKYTTPDCDMYSLGLLICTIYNNGKSLIQAGHNITSYTKQVEQLPELFMEVSHKIPFQLVEHVEKMISNDSKSRPTAQMFMLLKYFDDNLVQCMYMLDSVNSRDLLQKFDFFNKLPRAVPECPPKLRYNSIFPMLVEQLKNPDMLEFLLPSLMALVEHSSDEDFKIIIQPEFKKVFTMMRPVQATVYLLENINVILSKVSEEDVKADILPLIFNTLESNSILVQEAAINVFSNIRRYLDDQTMRRLVLPKAKALFQKSTNVKTRQNALACIDRLLSCLDKMIIVEEVLPFLTEIQCSEAEIIMSVIDIYKHLLSDKQFGLTHNLLATKVMPALIPHSVDPGLNIDQFSELMVVLNRMLCNIKKERLTKMISEVPDEEALELRRRLSTDMRYIVYEPPRPHNKYNLSILESCRSKYKPPSSPELQTNEFLESLGIRSCRRHSSYQGLGTEEQAVLSRLVNERRASLLQPPQPGNPHILVSEASVNNFEDLVDGGSGTLRRASTQSVGAVIVAEPGRRDSHGRLLDRVDDANRRSSLQGIYKHAMQFFTGK